MSNSLAGAESRQAWLDYLRVFAFVSVLIGHKYAERLGELAADDSIHRTLRDMILAVEPFYLGGGAGVVVFFLVSGYIIAQVAHRGESHEFLLRRILRIYPAFLIAVFLEAALGYWIADQPLPPMGQLLTTSLLIGDFFGTPLALAGVEWTLRVEVCFYLFVFSLKDMKVLGKEKVVIVAMLAITVFLQLAPPFPIKENWHFGYFTLYFPFLFIGSTIFIVEKIKRSSGQVPYSFSIFFSPTILTPQRLLPM